MTITKNKLNSQSIKLKQKKDLIKNSRYNPNYKKTNQISKLKIIFPKLINRTDSKDSALQWYFNGFVISINGRLLVVDPGVDFYARFKKAGLNLADIAVIFISHDHIDHSASLHALLDMLLRINNKIDLIITKDCYRTRVPYYLKKLLKNNINLILIDNNNYSEKKNYMNEYFKKINFIRLFHSSRQTFGFKINFNKESVVYISDTGYAGKVFTNSGEYIPEKTEGIITKVLPKHTSIKNYCKDVTIGIVNINAISYSSHSKFHLSAWDVLNIFSESKLKQLLVQHQYPFDLDGKSNGKIFKQFFKDEKYKTMLPLNKTITVKL